MFQVNDIVKYGTTGVCKIIDISFKNISGHSRQYFVLKPVHQESMTIYVPKDNSALLSKMQTILSAREIESLIDDMPSCGVQWIDNDKIRQESFKKIISSGNRKDLIGLVRTLYLRQEKLRQSNKKLHLVDARMMQEAEKLITDEFATVLHIETEEVVPFIVEKIKRKEAEASVFYQ